MRESRKTKVAVKPHVFEGRVAVKPHVRRVAVKPQSNVCALIAEEVQDENAVGVDVFGLFGCPAVYCLFSADCVDFNYKKREYAQKGSKKKSNKLRPGVQRPRHSCAQLEAPIYKNTKKYKYWLVTASSKKKLMAT